jgi:hypothetical protein
MKKHIALLLLLIPAFTLVQGQSRGVKIGYIDMEYILQNVPDYNEAKNQLEQKAQKWKQEIEIKKNEISRLKDLLATERVLLTKELLEEREEEIKFQEKVEFIESIDPITIHNKIKNIDFRNTFFIVISKSGETIETICQTLIVIKEMNLQKIKNFAEQFIFITESLNNSLAK